jgi:hypothetical protein
MRTNLEGRKYREMAALALWFFDRDTRMVVVTCNSGEKSTWVWRRFEQGKRVGLERGSRA